MEVSEECVIYGQPIGTSPKATLGSASINKASKERNESVHCTSGQQVHQERHHKYCKPDEIAKTLRLNGQQSTAANTAKQVLRSAEKVFDFSTDCFFVANQ